MRRQDVQEPPSHRAASIRSIGVDLPSQDVNAPSDSSSSEPWAAESSPARILALRPSRSFTACSPTVRAPLYDRGVAQAIMPDGSGLRRPEVVRVVPGVGPLLAGAPG